MMFIPLVVNGKEDTCEKKAFKTTLWNAVLAYYLYCQLIRIIFKARIVKVIYIYKTNSIFFPMKFQHQSKYKFNDDDNNSS